MTSDQTPAAVPRVELLTEESGHGAAIFINGEFTGCWFSDMETAALRARFTFDEPEPEHVTITIPRADADVLVHTYKHTTSNYGPLGRTVLAIRDAL